MGSFCWFSRNILDKCIPILVCNNYIFIYILIKMENKEIKTIDKILITVSLLTSIIIIIVSILILFDRFDVELNSFEDSMGSDTHNYTAPFLMLSP